MNTLQLAKQYEENIKDDVKKLISFKSLRDDSTISDTKPFGNACDEVLKYLLEKAEQDGFKVENVDGYAGVITLGNYTESVAMLGHLDVVPVDEKEWDQDPFIAYEKDGFIVGRGSTDDKGPTVAAYYALKMLKDQNISLKKNVQLIVGVDEESGMQCMKYFKENHQVPVKGIVPDAEFPVIFGEKGIINATFSGKNNSVIKYVEAGKRPNVVIGYAKFVVNGSLLEKEFNIFLSMNGLNGNCSFEEGCSVYEIYGKNFHASLAHKGINAVLYGLQFIGGFYQDNFSLNLYSLLKDPFGSGLKIDFDGAHMGPLTLNLGIFKVIDEKVEITLDLRYPNECIGEEIIHNIQTHLEELSLYMIDHSVSKPHFVDPNSTLVKSCMRAYQEISGDYETPPLTMGGGTYARTLENHVAFGADFINDSKPSWVGGPHEKNEAVSIENLIKATAIYAQVMEELANED